MMMTDNDDSDDDREVGEEDIGEDRVNDAKGLLPGGDLLQEEPDVLARHHILQLNLGIDRGKTPTFFHDDKGLFWAATSQ